MITLSHGPGNKGVPTIPWFVEIGCIHIHKYSNQTGPPLPSFSTFFQIDLYHGRAHYSLTLYGIALLIQIRQRQKGSLITIVCCVESRKKLRQGPKMIKFPVVICRSDLLSASSL